VPTILAPTTPVRFTIARLRQAVAEESRFSEQDLIGFINAGYTQACTRSGLLQTIGTVEIAAGQQTGAYPSDWYRTLGVFYAGVELEPNPMADSGHGFRNTYFQYGKTLGLGLGSPDTDTTVAILYVRTPDPLGLDDFPEWGREHDPILRSFAAWRCLLAAGGAQTIRKAQALRQEFDDGVRRLRRTTLGAPAGAQRKRTLSEFQRSPIAG